MKKIKIIAIISAIVFSVVSSILLHRNLTREMDFYDIIKNLTALRTAIQFHKLEVKTYPKDFNEIINSGRIEAVPEIKLKGHFRKNKVKNVQKFEIKNSGGWAYVANQSDKDFGLLYIDSNQKDAKGRLWSEF